ncbi:MAG: topoisomerase [Aeromicrobium sp.]|nr:topoisomerase [Aeromicrobium sp.]
MGKKSRLKTKAAKKERMPFVARTFEGLPGEADWIALREFVPSASAYVRLAGSDRKVRVCSLLPGAGAGIVRPDGEIWLGLQVSHAYDDISRDLAHVVEMALDTEPGNPVLMDDPGVGARLQDLIDPKSTFDVEVHDGFDYWIEGTDDSPEAAELLAEANDTIAPTVRLTSVDAAYWTEMAPHRYLRWVMTHDERRLLDALARLRVGGGDTLGEGSKLIGHFRAHGLLVPVWEFEAEAAALEEPAVAFAARLDEALADESPLTSEQRSARSALTSRQVTIR